jgi:hypothetical protein
MARSEAQRAYELDPKIDLTHLDTRPLRAMVFDAVEPMIKDAHSMGLLVALAQETLFVEVVKAFAERVVQLRTN